MNKHKSPHNIKVGEISMVFIYQCWLIYQLSIIYNGKNATDCDFQSMHPIGVKRKAKNITKQTAWRPGSYQNKSGTKFWKGMNLGLVIKMIPNFESSSEEVEKVQAIVFYHFFFKPQVWCTKSTIFITYYSMRWGDSQCRVALIIFIYLFATLALKLQ